ncbi:hypothetical protein U91I_00473 [alpha proteobacterium U9-1i]|nr:hypothetical protein U91I_00473 [alpha proteobacterium U9-1i]
MLERSDAIIASIFVLGWAALGLAVGFCLKDERLLDVLGFGCVIELMTCSFAG